MRAVLLCAFLVAFPVAGEVRETSREDSAVASSAPRLVVFEHFLRPGCPICKTAGEAITALETELADQPVVFIEQNVDVQIGNRQSRWWSAYTGAISSVYLPLIMLDSGHTISMGPLEDFGASFKAMIAAESVRPAEAEIVAYTRRVGDRLRVYAWIKNGSRETLNTATNGATVNAIIYEDAKLVETSHATRAVASVPITPALGVGREATFTLTSGELVNVNWDALHAVIAVDYRPRAGKAYDMVQAAYAQPAGLTVEPAATSLTVEPYQTSEPSATVQLRGPHVMSWTARSDADWSRVVPASGVLPASPTLTVDLAHLPAGDSTAHISFTAEGDEMAFTAGATVAVSYDPERPRRHLGGQRR